MGTTRTNALGQPIGEPVPGWSARPRPSRVPMVGRFCRVEPLDAAAHATDLHEAFGTDRDGRNWTYLPYGPFPDAGALRTWLAGLDGADDPLFHAVIDATTGRAAGLASFLRIEPANGSVEVGHIHFSPLVQRTPVATEAMYLMMRRAFDELGYRRYEWKCDDANAASKRAALRLGFTHEGLFRQHSVRHGRNHDTAWFSIVDGEWPERRTRLERWLDPSNFDEQDRQRAPLTA